MVQVWLTIAGLFQQLHQFGDALAAISAARSLDGYNADVECAHGILHDMQGAIRFENKHASLRALHPNDCQETVDSMFKSLWTASDICLAIVWERGWCRVQLFGAASSGRGPNDFFLWRSLSSRRLSEFCPSNAVCSPLSRSSQSLCCAFRSLCVLTLPGIMFISHCSQCLYIQFCLIPWPSQAELHVHTWFSKSSTTFAKLDRPLLSRLSPFIDTCRSVSDSGTGRGTFRSSQCQLPLLTMSVHSKSLLPWPFQAICPWRWSGLKRR